MGSSGIRLETSKNHTSSHPAANCTVQRGGADDGKPDQQAQTLHPCATDRRHRIQNGVKADAGAALGERG